MSVWRRTRKEETGTEGKKEEEWKIETENLRERFAPKRDQKRTSINNIHHVAIVNLIKGRKQDEKEQKSEEEKKIGEGN